MKRILGLAVLAAGTILGVAQVSRPQTMYELYSWRGPGGSWNFCLLPSPSGPNVTPEQVFSRRCLLRKVSDLKQRISDLPADSTVVWLDRFTGLNRSTARGRTLRYPPSNVIENLKQTAGDRHVKMELGTDEKAR